MSNLDEITNLIETQNSTWNASLGEIRKDIDFLQAKAGRPNLGASSNDFGSATSEHRKAFDAYLRTGADNGLSAIQAKSMNSTADADGGFLIPSELDQAIDRIAPTVSAMYRLANVVTIGTARYEKLVKTAGMAMRRVAEGATGGETTEPKYSKVIIDVATSEVEPWVHNETLDDSFVDLAADLANEAGIAFAEGGGSEFINGNGVAKARGILSYTAVPNASYAWGSIGYVPSGATSGFATSNPGDNIINLIGSLPIAYRQDAAFVMNDSTLNSIRQMKDGSGNFYLWQNDTTAPFGGRILGYPVEIDSNMPNVGTGSFAIAFGNWKRAYTIVNRTGTTLIRDPYTSKGITKFNMRKRFGGGVTNFEAIRLMRFATS